MKIRLLLPFFLLAFISQQSFAVNSVNQEPGSEFLQLHFGVDNASDFVNLTWKEAAAAQNQKLKFRDKVVMKLAQHNMKSKIKKGESFDAEEVYTSTSARFNLGGFLLGLLLGPLGVLIALLFGRNAIRSSLIGCLIWLLAIMIGWLL